MFPATPAARLNRRGVAVVPGPPARRSFHRGSTETTRVSVGWFSAVNLCRLGVVTLSRLGKEFRFLSHWEVCNEWMVVDQLDLFSPLCYSIVLRKVEVILLT